MRKLIGATVRYSGVGALLRESGWRSRRLLILCWHGLSLNDEHHWHPWLYTTAERFRRRLETIRDHGYVVLPLQEALERLWRGDLPPKSVTLTFDDGFYDFYAVAAPILREFGYPATVYLTTFYVDDQKPVFPLLVSYLLWKSGPGRRDSGRLAGCLVNRGMRKDLQDQLSWPGISRREKEDLVCEFARRAGIDYAADIQKQRLLHIMNPEEIRSLASSGSISFELHTHRHRTPEDPNLLSKELLENQSRITELTGRTPHHFSYPSGLFRPDMFRLLDRIGIRSAVTCEPQLVEASTNPYLVPRLLETPTLDDLTFQSWLDGSMSILRYRRSSAMSVSLNVSSLATDAGARNAAV